MDAIFFCLYNRTSDGNVSKVTRHIKKGEDKMTVAIKLEDGRVIQRERTKTHTRIKFMDGSQSGQDSTITQRDLESFIPSFDIFQSIFNTGSFMKLPDTNRRAMLMKLTKDIDRLELFEGMGAKKEHLNTYDIDLNNISMSYSRVRKERKITADRYASIQSVLASSEKIEVPEIEGKSLDKEISDIIKQGQKIAVVEKMWDVYEKGMIQYNSIIEDNKRRKDNLKKIEKELSGIKEVGRDYKGTDIITRAIQSLEEDKHKLDLKYSEDLADLPSSNDSFPDGDFCPTCKQPITKELLATVAKVKEERSKKRSELSAKLREDKKKIDITISNFKEEISKIEKHNQDLLAVNNKIDSLKHKIEVIKASIVEIKKPRKPLEQKISANELRKQHEKLTEENNKYKESLTLYNQAKKMEEDRVNKNDEMKKELKLLESELSDRDFLIAILSPKGLPSMEMDKKMEPIMTVFKKFLPGAEIRTLEPMKNGMEYKEVLKISVNGKDYAKMSLGESKKVDIVLSQIINNFEGSGVNLFFLDNAESIDHDIAMPKQAFVAKVTESDFELTTMEAKEEIEAVPF